MGRGQALAHRSARRALSIAGLCFALVAAGTVLGWADWPGVGENLPVCTANGEQYIPQAVVDGRDGCVIIWFDARSGMELINVYGQRVGAQGDTLWTPGGVQFTNVASFTWISYLVACADGNGGAFFAWEDPRSGSFDVYVQHADSTGAVSWTANGVELGSTGDDEYVMSIAPDGRGGCIVAWNRVGAASNILAQRVDAAGTKVWSASGVEVSVGTSNATRARIVSDGAAGIVACWLDGRYHPAWNEFKDIYAQRLDSLGTVCWADTSVVVLGFGSAPYYAFPDMVANDAGRFYVAWYDWRSSGFDIYAQSLDIDGQALWGAHGVPVCVNPLDQVAPRIAAGPADALFCAWVDHSVAIGGQLLDAAGAMQWSSSGVVMASTSYDLILGRAVRTSNDLYGVIYSESVSGGTDRYVKAQAVNGAGTIAWNAAGEPVSTVVSPKSNVQAVPDTCGGLIAVWTDDRNGSYASDIYAQRVDPAVGIGEAVGVGVKVASLQCAPNPFARTTEIRYSILDTRFWTGTPAINIYNAAGRLVRSFNPVSSIQDQESVVVWDGRDDRGGQVSSGVYFLALQQDGAPVAVQQVSFLR